MINYFIMFFIVITLLSTNIAMDESSSSKMEHPQYVQPSQYREFAFQPNDR